MQFLSIILVIYLEKDVLWSFKPHHSSTSLGLGFRDKEINRVEFWGVGQSLMWYSFLRTNLFELEMLLTICASVRPAMRGLGCDKIIPFPDYSQTTRISHLQPQGRKYPVYVPSAQSTSVVIHHVLRSF